MGNIIQINNKKKSVKKVVNNKKKVINNKKKSVKKVVNNKKKVINNKKKSVKKVVNKKKVQSGGGDFISDIRNSGNGLIRGNEQLFSSLKNLSLDIFCEGNSIRNMPKELDLDYNAPGCDVTKTKSWTEKEVKQ